jgi:uncharacterized protein (TIGR03435 family)
MERLGWTLVHFLWQGVLIAVLYGAIRQRWGLPHARYLLACAALAAMVTAPFVTFGLLGPSEFSQPSAPLAASAARASGTGARIVDSVQFPSAGPARENVLAWVVWLWLAGASAFWVRLMGGWWIAARMRSERVRPAPPEWQAALDRLGARIGLSRPVQLLISALVEVPTVVGWLRPVVLVPVAALAGLAPEHVEALLAHELAHIRRHDYLVNILQTIAEALLFYHPAVWWISGHIRTERELCCDDVAVSVTGDALTYASALAELESNRLTRFNAALAANGGSLADRIARLLGQSRPHVRTLPGPGLIASAILLVITALALFGQPSARPKFEVASIKPSPQQGLMRLRPLPGRLTADASLRLLMQNAYTVQPYQIVGGAAWIGSERYELDAKTDSSASRAQMFLMLQSLLEDRFQLKIHRETRELAVYALLPARRGLKLPPPKDGGCVQPAPDAPSDWVGGRMAPPAQGPLPRATCGVASVMLAAPLGARIQGGKIAMPEFIRVLSMVLGRSVIDKTGFTGSFDLGLNFLPDEATPAMPPPPPDAAGAPPVSNNPSILTAIHEQLGLRLESTKGPVETLVIDHAERPTEN